MKFFKFEHGDNFLVVQSEFTYSSESKNTTIIYYRQFLSNFESDDLNCNKLEVSRGCYSSFVEIDENEFREFVQNKVEDLQKIIDEDKYGCLGLYYGKLIPKTLLKF